MAEVLPDTSPASEMPTELQAHVRYPEDIFSAQRLVYSRYHVTDPASFYPVRTSGTSRPT